MSQGAPAWMLDCGGGVVVATGLANVLHVIEDTSALFRVPMAPAHCNRVLLWQQRVLPAVDLAALLIGAAPPAPRLYACVLGWRVSRNDTEYGVLLARGLPRRITVSDDQRIRPSDSDAERWRGIGLSFFSYHKRATPIVDPASLFGSVQHTTATTAVRASHRIA